MPRDTPPKTFPGFSSLYVLEDPFDPRAFRANFGLSSEMAIALTRAEQKFKVEVRWAAGAAKPGDIVWTRMGTPMLMRDRVVELLEREGFTGWGSYPVSIAGKQGNAISEYHGLAVSGRCGAIDDSRSVKLDRIFPGGVFPVLAGLYFDPGTWDGSDLFATQGGSNHIFVVEAVKRALERAKVKNVTFTPVHMYQRDILR